MIRDATSAKITSSVMSRDNVRARNRMGRSLTASAVVHALLFLLLLVTGGSGSSGEMLTEISWIDGDPGSAATPTPAVNAAPVPSGPAPEPTHFERRVTKAEVTSDPQSISVPDDQLENRLTALQRDASRSSAPALAVGTGTGRGSGLATTGRGGSGGIPSPISLRREGTRQQPPLELRRVDEATPVPIAAAIGEAPRKEKAAERRQGVASRELAGATLLGPVADRKLLRYSTPAYPEWAKREGVEGSVRLYFLVSEEGHVRENIVVEKTSGYPDFDSSAVTALSGWLFEPLPGNQVGDQWGQITFKFRLDDGD
ncbi:MAG TPA: energy transducer TonB [Candidatus Eisenbacteria bacterium]|nr:energy transducer TonB [Candidatus Eisenbacteria bacterium]